MRKEIKCRYRRLSSERSKLKCDASRRMSAAQQVDGGIGKSPCGKAQCEDARFDLMEVSEPRKVGCGEGTVCSICYIRSLEKPRSVQLECKHFLCNVCYNKVFCCPFCRCPLYGSIGKRLKRATKMFLCLLKQFKRHSCCKAGSVMLLQKLLEKTKEQAKLLDPEKEGVKKIKSRIYTLSGTVYFKLLGELERASVEYKEALALNPQNLEAINLYAGVLSRQGFCQGAEPVLLAIDLMKKGLKLDPENPILLCNLSKYHAQIGNIDVSISLLEQAERLQSNNEAIEKYICCNKQFLNTQILAKQAAQVVGFNQTPCMHNYTAVPAAASSLPVESLCKD